MKPLPELFSVPVDYLLDLILKAYPSIINADRPVRLQSGPPNAKTTQALENGRIGANRELNVGFGVISRTSLPGRMGE